MATEQDGPVVVVGIGQGQGSFGAVNLDKGQVVVPDVETHHHRGQYAAREGDRGGGVSRHGHVDPVDQTVGSGHGALGAPIRLVPYTVDTGPRQLTNAVT